MKLFIHDNLLVEEVQGRFADCFPGLKIEFYSRPHHWKASSSDAHRIDSKTKLGQIRRNHHTGTLEIKSTHSAGEVEADLRRVYGLNVQVFRNENGAWIQTSSTDAYTLKEQMDFAEKAKQSILPEVNEQLDEYGYL